MRNAYSPIKLAAFSASAIILLNYGGFMAGALKVEGNEEGPCSSPLPEPQKHIEFDWVQSVSRLYFSAGSKYQYYRIASGNPFFPLAREFEFFYGFCPSVVLDFNAKPNTMDTFGFGGSTGRFTFTSPKTGMFDLIPQPPIPGSGQKEHMIAVETLTDNKSFAFYYKCWKNVNQRGWEVFSTTPGVSPQIQKQIEDHAVSLGFDRKNFQFLRYELCKDKRYRQTCNVDEPKEIIHQGW